MKKFIKGERKKVFVVALVLAVFLASFSFIILASAEDPEGPSIVNVTSNTTRAVQSPYLMNVSGGRIAAMNITTTIQNQRWKGFIGWVDGKFTLQDAGGSTLYDWIFAVTGGMVHATRTSGSITWSAINCTNLTMLETENLHMAQTRAVDNITFTFNDTSHQAFSVGSKFIGANKCRSFNTFVNNASQNSAFEEMAMDDGTNIVYSTRLENNAVGYSGADYDFQMLVPEMANATAGTSTAYYLYVEIS